MSKTGIMGVVFVLMGAMILILMYMYSLQSLAATDMGVNLTGTQYIDQYNSSVNASKVGMSFVGFTPILIGSAGLLGALFLMFVAIKH